MCEFSEQLNDFESTLETLFCRVLDTCENGGFLKEKQRGRILKLLEDEHLTPIDIVEDCLKELKCTCVFEYNEVVPGSNRFQGKGNSTHKIEHHMKVFLKEKLKIFSGIISQTNLNGNPISKKTKSFSQVLEDIKRK